MRERFKLWFHGDSNAKLTVAEEAWSGIIGGALACWNPPFEVARIEMQAAANAGEPPRSMVQVGGWVQFVGGCVRVTCVYSNMSHDALFAYAHPQVFQGIVKTEGVQGLFKGIIPRIGLGIWQTLFMVTGAKLLKQYL